jgi:hypothetical protein
VVGRTSHRLFWREVARRSGKQAIEPDRAIVQRGARPKGLILHGISARATAGSVVRSRFRPRSSARDQASYFEDTLTPPSMSATLVQPSGLLSIAPADQVFA